MKIFYSNLFSRSLLLMMVTITHPVFSDNQIYVQFYKLPTCNVCNICMFFFF